MEVVENLVPQDAAPKTKHSEDVMEKNVENSNSIMGSTSDSINLENVNISNSDIKCQVDNGDGDVDDDHCDMSDYGDDDDYLYDNDDDDYDYLSMQAQFDDADLPPGVEASVSWLKDSSSNSNAYAPTNVSSLGAAGSSSSNMAASTPSLPPHLCSKVAAIAASTISVCAESNYSGKEKVVDGDGIMRKYESFKRFDVVDDYSDHHYSNSGFQGQQPSSAWSKKIQDEWKILETNLPDTIYVRACESRMDLLRAIIVGPQGTPYHDGLFVFDAQFPLTYPDVPPIVYYYSGGLRLNPNLYDSGKVCLSLLNTWPGRASEKWMPKSSTMLQVLVSIQALILNSNPFFNEPGYETQYVGQDGERKSKAYNEDVFVLSLKTMVYTLRRPPKHFEDLVAGHFRVHAHAILAACRAYMEGAVVGSLVNGKFPEGNAPRKSASSEFKDAVGRMINGLISNFSRYGVPGCEQFRPQR